MGLVEQIPAATTIDLVSRNQNIRLDHVGFTGGALEAMRAEWQSLGFCPTEPEELRAVDRDGTSKSLGQRSCHIVLQQGYIELTEIVSPSPQHHLAPWLAKGAGLQILAFGVDDIASWHEIRGGASFSPVMTATRHVAYGDRHGEARFLWCMREPRETPWALECVVEHLTPELVHQGAVEQHPNGASALVGVTLQCPEPDVAARQFASLYGLGPSSIRCAGGVVAHCTIVEIAVADLAAWQRRAGAVTTEIALATAPGCRLRLVQG